MSMLRRSTWFDIPRKKNWSVTWAILNFKFIKLALQTYESTMLEKKWHGHGGDGPVAVEATAA